MLYIEPLLKLGISLSKYILSMLNILFLKKMKIKKSKNYSHKHICGFINFQRY